MHFIVSFWLFYILTKIINFLLSFSFFKGSKIPKSILYLENFPMENAGYQYRVAKWAELLKKEGFKVDVWTLIEDKSEFDRRINEKPFSKFLLFALKKRFKQVLASCSYETVIVRRELLWFNDYGNLFMDRLLLKIHPNTILDFDDDIAFAKKEPRKITSLYGKILFEDGKKFTNSLKLYKKFIVGSNYLADYVIKENRSINFVDVLVLPTCVNYANFGIKQYDNLKHIISIGWVGGNNNLFLLNLIIAPLNRLAEKYDIELIVISGKRYQSKEANFKIRNIQWSLETEVENIKQIDIGIMPLTYTHRDKGKCSFKLIQYMGLGIVSIATNVGMNTEVINLTNEEGFLTDNNMWTETFETAIKQRKKWNEIGQNARKKILSQYTFNSNLSKLMKFLKSKNNND